MAGDVEPGAVDDVGVLPGVGGGGVAHVPELALAEVEVLAPRGVEGLDHTVLLDQGDDPSVILRRAEALQAVLVGVARHVGLREAPLDAVEEALEEGGADPLDKLFWPPAPLSSTLLWKPSPGLWVHL
jgi:hypothetical protein